jgi:16S rRNA (cytosine967-C5)-methyltransferase
VGVELIKREIGKYPAGYANALFKKMQKVGLQKKSGNSLDALGVNFSHPLWLIKRWHKRLGRQVLESVLRVNNNHDRHWFRINLRRADLTQVTKRLRELSLEPEFSRQIPFFRLRKGVGTLLHNSLFKRGAIAVQDPAGWYAACLADHRPQDSLLDLCGAPGGKSACFMEFPGRKLPVVCADISPTRLKKIHDVRQRLGHREIHPLVMDACNPALKCCFQRVFVDAPCSNLGVISRRPETKWRIRPQTLKKLATTQLKLLESAARLCRRDGVLVYATCSPEQEETYLVVEKFLVSNQEWKLDDATDYVPAQMVRKKCFWLFPGETPYDGYFAARLVRHSATS